MSYTKTNWVNDQAPAINASNLNKIEQGIFDNDAGIANLLQEIGINADTWVSTNTYSLGDVVVYNKKLYKNITGNYTTTNPASDTTNWNEIQIINNNGKLNKSLIPYFNNSNSNATDEGYSCNYINGDVLYDDTTGTTGNIQLSNSIDYYRYLEIFYISSGYQSSLKIDLSLDKTFILNRPFIYSGAYYDRMSKYSIANSTITYIECLTINSNFQTVRAGDPEIVIKKVIGYK